MAAGCPKGEPDTHLGLGEGAAREQGEDEAGKGVLLGRREMRHPVADELTDEVCFVQIGSCALWVWVFHSEKIPHNALFFEPTRCTSIRKGLWGEGIVVLETAIGIITQLATYKHLME